MLKVEEERLYSPQLEQGIEGCPLGVVSVCPIMAPQSGIAHIEFTTV